MVIVTIKGNEKRFGSQVDELRLVSCGDKLGVTAAQADDL